MTERYPLLYRIIQGSALMLAVTAVLFPGGVHKIHAVLALVLILFGGIPHGATDYVIFKNVHIPKFISRKMATFVALYLLMMGFYTAIWWMIPSIGLLIFLGISVFHFGQSNWAYIQFPSAALRIATYVLWGTWVLFFPVVWHFDDSRPIIAELLAVPREAVVLPLWGTYIPHTLVIATTGLIVALRMRGVITGRNLRDELLNLFILTLCFSQLPLLLGFALYFVGWHSFTSILDQIRMYRGILNERYTMANYLRDVWPFSLLAIAFMCGWLFWSYQAQTRIDWAFLFVFVSIVTLPHMLLIDQLYSQKPNDFAASGEKYDENSQYLKKMR